MEKMKFKKGSKQEKLRMAAHSQLIGQMKLAIDRGYNLSDLNFNVFEEKADEMKEFMIEYIKIKKMITEGIDFFNDKNDDYK